MSNNGHPHSQAPDAGCLALPRFERVKYFFGQLLGVREFQSEQSYFLEKHRLHNRYLHGYGVVCGLEVKRVPPPPDPCGLHDGDKHDGDKHDGDKHDGDKRDGDKHDEHGHEPRHVRVEIDCGLALDCRGNEIAVPWPARVDVLELLSCDDRKEFLHGRKAYLSLCFVEQPIEPVRPLSADGCGGLVPECVPSRLRDDFCVRISLEVPPHDGSCSPCQRPCNDPCLPLAVLHWHHGLHVDNSIRRTIAPFVPTRVSGVSWVHDGTYRPGQVDHMLRDGLVIEFSDDVHVSTLRRGVIDIWIIQGGGGRRGDIYSAAFEVIPVKDPAHPDAPFTRSVIARMPSHRGDRIDPGDRVLIQLRTAFVLDRCCRAVDGEHIGGQVPQLPSCHARWPCAMPPPPPPCMRPEPRPLAPWTSGNGNPAGNFESWFFVGDDDHDHK